MTGWMPNSSSASVVVGPMEQTWHWRRCGERGLLDAQFAGHAGEVGDLYGGGEEGDIEVAGGQAAGGFAQRFGVLGEVPPVDADGGDVGAAARRASSSSVAGRPYSWMAMRRAGVACERGQEFAPGVGLGGDDGGFEAEVAQGGDGLGSARGDGDAAQGFGEGVLGIARGQYAMQLAGADAGEQDDHVEFAGEEALGEGEDGVVIGERDFAHGGGDEGLAALLADELLHFGGAAAFQREHAESVEGHISLWQSEMRTACCLLGRLLGVWSIRYPASPGRCPTCPTS